MEMDVKKYQGHDFIVLGGRFSSECHKYKNVEITHSSNESFDSFRVKENRAGNRSSDREHR